MLEIINMKYGFDKKNLKEVVQYVFFIITALLKLEPNQQTYKNSLIINAIFKMQALQKCFF